MSATRSSIRTWGTGATMIAADSCGRSSIGFEIDVKCEMMVKRRIEFDLRPLIDEIPEYEIVRIEE